MDDLLGSPWSSTSEIRKPTPQHPSVRSGLQPSPSVSRGSTPFSQPSGRSVSPAKATAGGDSFASLVNFRSGGSEKNLSLAERQRRLAEQRAKEEKEKRERLEAQYGAGSGDIWSRLEAAGSSQSGNSNLSTDKSGQPIPDDDEDDLLAAFNASAPVDTSTHFPVPTSSASPPFDSVRPSLSHTPNSGNVPSLMEDDDDPFGLANLKLKQPIEQDNARQQSFDDDDILGPLAKPVSEFTRQDPESPPQTAREEETASVKVDATLDKPLAELVDMGFSIEDAREALASTESGTDVQTAVGWLLNKAHEESRRKAQAKDRQRSQRSGNMEGYCESSADCRPERIKESGTPAWMRVADYRSASRSETPSHGRGRVEKDPAQLAAEFGSNLFKSANSLWKSGTRRMQQVVQEFNSPADPSQPRWMRHAITAETVTHQERKTGVQQEPSSDKRSPSQSEDLITDEALMLESQRPPHHKSNRHSPVARPIPQRPAQQVTRSPAMLRTQQPPRPQNAPQSGQDTNLMDPSRSRLTRLNAEEDAAQAYVSPARRRRAVPSSTMSESEPNLLEPSTVPPQPKRPPTTSPVGRQQSTRQSSAPLQLRPKPRPRSIPPIQPSSLQACTQHRQKGSDAFRRGDYSAAHSSYSTALSLIPDTHPIAIVLLTNRALTSLKIGEPKTAISDADRALSIIGPGKGELEEIDLGNDEPRKNMKEFFGKALMRKAEALEQLEHWAEAAKVWQEAVESGLGGNTSIQGRNRCEKAAGIKPSSASSTPAPHSNEAQSKPSRPAVKPSPASVSTKPSEAVSRLRAANEAADRADNEKFALADVVDARINAWKNGKQDNLRALLASLDTVLWPEAQWKKINMSELLLPNKVKIQYMKGIAKVHPDKLPVNATTEQKMIAGAVFSTLNDAWDKFKRENGL
ncbi:hypothetical protein VTO42DRAFT_6433 [Malbranchea cinnamomea]